MMDGSLLPAIEKFDLVEYCIDHGGDQNGEGQDEWTLLCPSCGKDNLSVNVLKKTWHCWTCQNIQWVHTTGGLKKRALAGAGGLIDLIQFLDEVTRHEAVMVILRNDLLDPSVLSIIPQGDILKSYDGDFKDLEWASAIPFPEGMTSVDHLCAGYAYLLSRGVPLDDLNRFGLSWCVTGRYIDRIVFPVWENGSFVYFQARTILPPQLGGRYVKALNPARIEGAAVSSEVLFNFDQAIQYPAVVLSEGPMDAIHIGPEAVATFGKQISGIQIAKLVCAGVKCVELMWDGDALSEAYRFAPLLAAFFEVRIVQLPFGTDPGDFTREQNTWYRQQARHYTGGLLTL